MKIYDLTNDKYIGKRFQVTYKVIEDPEVDQDVETIYNRIRTITSLKLLH